jgi:hypothetical protein
VGRAAARQVAATIALWALPFTAMLAIGAPHGPARLFLGGLVDLVLVSFVWDLVVFGGALRAARRMARGLPPTRPGIDYGVGPNMWWQTVPADAPYRAQDRLELVAVGSPSLAAKALARNLRRRAAGGALALLFAAAIPSTCHNHCHPIGSTATALNTLRSATILYANSHPGACPSFASLKAEGLIEHGFSSKDPWGNEWDLRCDEDDVVAHSNGPDRKAGTEDDIVVPRPEPRPDAAAPAQ